MSRYVVLAGGVGAARFLRGLVAAVDPTDVTAVVNTADDVTLYGLHISPDLDTVTYTLAAAVDDDRGWGLENETWQAMEMLRRYGDAAWFNLGDRDLGTHMFRTNRLRQGATLTEVTAEIAGAWSLGLELLPMTDDEVETRIVVDGTEIGFQEYFVERQHDVAVSAVRFRGIEASTPGPMVLDRIAQADSIVIAPSNPIVSIGPILAVPGIADAIESRRDATVAISPIVGGSALKGPADRMLVELGHTASASGVASLYSRLAGSMVIDTVDSGLVGEVEALGMSAVVTDTVMSSTEVAANLACEAIRAGGGS